MTSPSIDITWSLAEAEAAYAGIFEIGLEHFWVNVCKAEELPVSELLKAGSRDRLPGLAKSLASVIDKALVRNPKDRFPDAGKLQASLLKLKP
jgi:hypothetical protein